MDACIFCNPPPPPKTTAERIIHDLQEGHDGTPLAVFREGFHAERLIRAHIEKSLALATDLCERMLMHREALEATDPETLKALELTRALL